MIARNRIRSPRRGMSMAEVLVALFLLALGTIAILTMFPLGMYHMGQALKDDRTAQAANQADAFMRMYWRENVVQNRNARFPTVANQTSSPPGYEPFVLAFDHPDWYADFSVVPLAAHNNLDNTNQPLDEQPPPNGSPGTPALRRGTAAVPWLLGQSGPSYPVFVDPMGAATDWNILNPNAFDLRYWVGGTAYPRRTLNACLTINSPPWSAASSRTQALMNPQRICSMLDGYGYDEGGVPLSVTGVSGGQFERDLRYNWMWILQRPDNTDVNTAKMTVVVFDRRAYQFAPQNAEPVFATSNPNQPFTVLAPGSVPANVNFTAPGTAFNTIIMTPGTTTLQIPTALGVPPVQKGGWIMDASHLGSGNFAAGAGMRHGKFYRVVSVTDNPNNQMIANGVAVTVPTTDIELQVPISRMDGFTNPYPGTLIYFAGVSEVFERPNLRANEY